MVTNSFIKRNFLNQTGDFNTTWKISANNLNGSGTFGISGAGEVYSFTIKSGEIYDPYNKLLGSYRVNIPFTLRNDISNSKDSLYYNESPKFLFKANDFFTNHNYNYFFVDPSGLDIDFDFFIRGESTTLQISALNTRLRNDNTNETINFITGRLTNLKPSINVKIFDGSISNHPEYAISGLPLSFNNSGDFYITTDSGSNIFKNNTIDLPITFNTNFGEVNFNLPIVNQYIPLQFSSLISLPEGNVNIPNNSVQDFIIRYGSSSGSYLSIDLTYISGTTGFFTGNILGTGHSVGIISGLVTGSRLIQKTLDSQKITGYSAYSGRNVTADIQGVKIEQFIYATGDVSLQYSVTGTGLGTGFVYLTVPSSGAVTVSVSGFVPYVGGGLINYTTGGFLSTGQSVNIEGSPIQITGYSDVITNITRIYYTGDIFDVFLSTGQYSNKIFFGGHTGSLASQRIISEPYYLLATGFGTGNYTKTGVVSGDFFRFFEGGNYFFSKNVTGTSGYFSITDSSRIITGLSGLLNCKETTNEIYYSGIGLISGLNKFNIYLDECSSETPVFHFLCTGKTANDFQLFSSIGNNVVSDKSIPKFLIIKVSGNESQFADLENLNYLTENAYGTGIRTRISHLGDTPTGSGYFSGIFSSGACESQGIWEHNFIDFSTKTGIYQTNNYISSFESKIISSEDNIASNFNSIKFTIL